MESLPICKYNLDNNPLLLYLTLHILKQLWSPDQIYFSMWRVFPYLQDSSPPSELGGGTVIIPIQLYKNMDTLYEHPYL